MLTQEEVVIKSSGPHHCCVKRICWKAIFAGALVGFGLTFLLQIFDKAIGVTVFTVNASGVEAMVFGGFLGSIVGIIASMFFAGWVAGYLSRPHFFDRRIGALYGLLVWCLALLFGMIFMSHIGSHGMDRANYLTNPNSSVVSMNTSQTASVIASETAGKPNANQNAVNNDMPAKKAGISLFLTFILFFIGAVSASFGGYFGLKAERKIEPVKSAVI